MQPNRNHIVVLGGGVVGLTTAYELAKSYRVTVIADKLGAETNSRLATAVWHVFLIKGEQEISASDPHLFWAERTLERLVEIAGSAPDSGVEMVRGVELFRIPPPVDFPAWMSVAQKHLDLKFLDSNDLASYNSFDGHLLTESERIKLEAAPVKWGYSLMAPAAKMTKYLDWLVDQNMRSGVVFRRRELTAIQNVEEEGDIIINCTGLGSRTLVGDHDFTPYKGQYFVLPCPQEMPTFYVGDDHHPSGMAYAIPRAGEILVGGTAEPNRDDIEGTISWDEVYKRASLYFPWLRERNISPGSVGLPVVGVRPVRSSGARLELDQSLCRIPVIHNYGHGGSGFSLSWGCAERVAALLSHWFERG